MAQEHIVKFYDKSDPRIAKIDLATGWCLDTKGNQVVKWEPADGEHTELLSDYAYTRSIAGAIATTRFHHGADAAKALAEQLVQMDLGPSDVHIPAALPNYASGYQNEMPMADLLSPPLLVDKPIDDYYQFDKGDAFEMVAPTVNAGGGSVNEISPRLANSQFKTTEYALGGFTTAQLEAASDAALRIKQATVDRIVNALMINREQRVATQLTATGTWDTSVVSSLSSAQKWNGGASSDPIADLQTASENSWGTITAIGMALPTFHQFLRNAAVQKFVMFKDDVAALPKLNELLSQFALPPILVGKMQYMDTSATKKYIWGNNVVLIRQPAQMPPHDQRDVASNITFRWNGTRTRDGVVQGGMVVREFYVQDRGSGGGMKAIVLHQDAETQTSTFAGALISGAVQ